MNHDYSICSHQPAASPPLSTAPRPDSMIAAHIIKAFSYSANVLFAFPGYSFRLIARQYLLDSKARYLVGSDLLQCV